MRVCGGNGKWRRAKVQALRRLEELHLAETIFLPLSVFCRVLRIMVVLLSVSRKSGIPKLDECGGTIRSEAKKMQTLTPAKTGEIRDDCDGGYLGNVFRGMRLMGREGL